MTDGCSTTGGSEPSGGSELSLDVGTRSRSEAGDSAPLEDLNFDCSVVLDCTVYNYGAPEVENSGKNGSVSWVSDIALLRFEFAVGR